MKNGRGKFFVFVGLVIVVLGVSGFRVVGHAAEKDGMLEKYSGAIPHIFFHSLIVYPQKAAADKKHFRLYRNDMITVERFKTILEEFYNNNFVLIDSRLLYSVDAQGKVRKADVYVPKGKKPFVLSVDDLSYYSFMKDGGFANKLVLDKGVVKTEVITPEGKTIVTDDGDVIPIVDRFIKEHPDFSLNGAKGIIAATGFEGILGYRTQLAGDKGKREKDLVMPVVDALKKSGWIFASHSYGHQANFTYATIAAGTLAEDIQLWKDQVEPLVGPTNIFIGPFGQTFREGDPRRTQLINAGFHVLYRVGADDYIKYYDNYVIMDRINIDGYRLRNSPNRLFRLFGWWL